MRSQKFDELVVGKATGLGQSVHSATDFDEDVSVVDKR